MGASDKSRHVGNHGGRYTDLSGQSKQFTYVDHDKKLKMSKNKVSAEELDSIKQQLKDYKQELIDRVLIIPASLCPDAYQSFTIRGSNLTTIIWNETMLRDEGVETERLRNLVVMLENTVELHKIII